MNPLLFINRAIILVALCFVTGCVARNESSPTSAGTPEVLPSTYKIARPVDPKNIAWDVIQPMWDHVDFYQNKPTYDRTLAPATKGLIAIHSCTWYLSEVNNGGHDQFFFNSTGMVWQNALDGFQLLGANDHFTVLQEAVSAFPDGSPSFDRATRNDQLDTIEKGVFDKLDDRVYAMTEDFDKLCADYINAHPGEFFVE